MLKMLSTTIILAVLFPAYTLAYVVSKALNLKDHDLMDTPVDFILIAIDEYYDATAETRYIKKLTKKVEQFYKDSMFIPAPAIIDLYDADCVAKITEDIRLFGEDQTLIDQIESI